MTAYFTINSNFSSNMETTISPTRLKALAKAVASNYANPSKSTINGYIKRNPPKRPIEDCGTSKTDILFAYFERIDEAGILNCIQHFLDPALFIGQEDDYKSYRASVNAVLSFIGYEIDAEGRCHRIEKSKTLSDAQRRKEALIGQIEARKMHPCIIKYCRDELFENDYYSVVFESIKGIYDTIRELSRCKELDGANLIDKVFSRREPMLLINDLKNDSEISAHIGFATLLKGLNGHFRNPAAHEVKIKWRTTEEEVLEILGIVSYVHRVLDSAVRTCYAERNSIV